LKKIGISERRITNLLSNYALVEWADNIAISDKPPKEYVPQYEARFSEKELKDMYFWHGLPRKWYEMEFNDFLQERQTRMAKVIRKGFEKLRR